MDLGVVQLGVVPYEEALELQLRLRELRQAGEIGDTLLLLEHPPVYTRGRRTQEGELPMGADWYLAQGIDIADTPRGGRVTYHGPGQLVGYAIMRTDDVVEHVRSMERAIVTALAEHGIDAHARVEDGPDFTGVWVGERKIASIGVHVSRGVTAHGFAVNVDNDLQPFEWVVPCGLDGVRMTSVYKQTDRADGIGCFRKRVAYRFAQAHGMRQRIVSLERLLGIATVLV